MIVHNNNIILRAKTTNEESKIDLTPILYVMLILLQME